MTGEASRFAFEATKSPFCLSSEVLARISDCVINGDRDCGKMPVEESAADGQM